VTHVRLRPDIVRREYSVCYFWSLQRPRGNDTLCALRRISEECRLSETAVKTSRNLLTPALLYTFIYEQFYFKNFIFFE
jgi:hypothetical protein